MKEVLLTIFGVYEPLTGPTLTATGEIVQTVIPGMAGVDWPYIAAVALFALTLYCFFRLLGVLLK
jgi:hypothetical protein